MEQTLENLWKAIQDLSERLGKFQTAMNDLNALHSFLEAFFQRMPNNLKIMLQREGTIMLSHQNPELK